MHPDRLFRSWAETWFMTSQCSQFAEDLIIWERVLNQHQPKQIIELGTLYGGFSLFLCLQAIQRNATFTTFDIDTNAGHKAFDTPLGKLLDLRSHFVCGDIFNETACKVVELIKQPGQTILYCDDGNKPAEVALFAQHLKPGDLLVVHDWGTEIKAEHIPYDWVEEIESDMLDSVQSMTRFFVRK